MKNRYNNMLIVLTLGILPLACGGGGSSTQSTPSTSTTSTISSLSSTSTQNNPVTDISSDASTISTSSVSGSTTTGNSSSDEIDIHNRVNVYRQSLGLSTLTYDEMIADQSRSHSQNMANGSVPPGHAGFDERANVIVSALSAVAVAENVALNKGYDNPNEQAVSGWINSPGHEANMRGDYSKSGVGIAVASDGTVYFTHMFAR